MNTSKKQETPAQVIFVTVIVIGLMVELASTLYSAEPPAGGPPPQATNSVPVATNSVAANAKTPDLETKKVVAKPQLTGAELYSINCNRCHQERYPTERTGAQWKTIMLHMQVRANMPVGQAKLILQYLEENSGR